MVILAYGNSCVSVQAEVGNDVSVAVLDPFEGEGSMRLPRGLTADLVFCSRADATHGFAAGVGGTPYVVRMPGEFEVKGMMLDTRTLPLDHAPEHLIARLYAEGMTVGYLGGLSRELTEEETELVSGVDILVLPVSGGDLISSSSAAAIAQTVEPRILIPLGSASDIASFKKEFGPVRVEETAKFKIAKKSLPVDDVLLVVLNA